METRFHPVGEFTIRFGSDCACPPCEGKCPVARRSDDDFLDSVLRRIAPKSAELSIDDISVVVGDALKHQRQEILRHVRRMLEMERLNSDRKSTRLNSSHLGISYAVFCLKKKTK